MQRTTSTQLTALATAGFLSLLLGAGCAKDQAAPGDRPAEEPETAGAFASAAPPPRSATGGGLGAARPAPGRKGYDGHAEGAPPLWQAPGVRAGEWDDNANYREFTRYLSSSYGVPYHHVDVAKRRFVVVYDQHKRPVPNCRVTVSDGQTATVLTTTASGRAVLFPRAMGLTGHALTASTRCQDASAQRSFSLTAADGVVELGLPVARALPQTRTVDVAFILDTTGSMSEEIQAVKATIQKAASQLSQGDVKVRLGLVEYKDRGDDVHTRVYPMTGDLGGFSRQTANLHASGGGDTPEDAVAGLAAGLDRLQWDERSVARLAFLIGDAPPHLDYPQGTDYERHAKHAASRGIKVFTIAASGMDALGQMVWRQIAQLTGATNMFVLRGGAGPASTGGGDPKKSCGGTHENYTSGDLDQLIANKVQREIRALDGDPLRIAGLGQDEHAKPCDQRVAWQ